MQGPPEGGDQGEQDEVVSDRRADQPTGQLGRVGVAGVEEGAADAEQHDRDAEHETYHEAPR